MFLRLYLLVFLNLMIWYVLDLKVVVGSDDTYAACWNSSTYGTAILDKLVELGMSRDDQESFYYLWHTFTHRAADMITSYYQRFKRNNKLIIWGGNVEPETGTPVTYNMVARPDVVEELPPSDYIMEVLDLLVTIVELLILSIRADLG